MNSPVQEPFENFENVKFDAFEPKDFLLDDSSDPNKTSIITLKPMTRNIISHQSLSLSEKLRIN